MIDREHDKLCNHYKKDFSHTRYIYVSALNILFKKFPTTRYILIKMYQTLGKLSTIPYCEFCSAKLYIEVC